MANEFENENSPNLEIEDVTTIDDLDALKEKYSSLASKSKEVGDKNRQLFERAKKAEGEVKELKLKVPEKPDTKETGKPDEELLKRLDKLALKTSGISEADEVELFEKWKTDTGRDADSITENSIFKKELAELRTAKANQTATSDIKGESSSGARNTPEYWIAKATKGSDGQLLFPEEMPKELYSKVVDKLTAKDSKKDLRFYNE